MTLNKEAALPFTRSWLGYIPNSLFALKDSLTVQISGDLYIRNITCPSSAIYCYTRLGNSSLRSLTSQYVVSNDIE
jgi:hypothetical protein